MFNNKPGGRICNREDSDRAFLISKENTIITVFYRTDDSNTLSDVKGLEVFYELIGKYVLYMHSCV